MIGKTISHYRILEKLGEGGMGVVYKAEDTKLKRTVALKFLASQAVGIENDKARFIHEAQAAASLNHPNICTVHEIDEFEGQSFIAMECVDGESLKVRIGEGPFDIGDAIDISIRIAEGLLEAHAMGIVHRDIKPGNIMLTPGGQVKIMDFGLAKSSGREQLTRAGTTMGTVAYMSPEQGRGNPVDHRTDIWSLGVILYEMVAGLRPFKGDYEQAVMYSVLNEEVKPLTGERSGVTIEFERIVNKCLAKDPVERYQHVDDLLVDLRRSAEPPTSSGKAGIKKVVASSERRGVFARVVGMAAIAAVAAILLIVVYLRFFGSPPESSDARVKKLAVLFFENLGPPDDEYFADGITDAITARLAVIHGLGVISRQSTVQYKDSEKSIRDIGEELGADYILEGTIQRERPGDPTSRVRIIPQLISVSDDIHVWADTYDEDVTEVFRVQSSIAERVAHALNVTLLATEREAIEAIPTENIEAYEYYLRGNEYFQNRMSMETARLSVEMYQRAIELDPEFAAAWAGLSKAYIWNYYSTVDRTLDQKTAAKTAVDKANELAPDSPDVQIAFGYYYYYGDRDFDRALDFFERALDDCPNNVEILCPIAFTKRRQNKWDEGVGILEKAVELNPRFVSSVQELGITYLFMRQYDKAERLFDRAIFLAPENPVGHFMKVLLFLLRDGDTERAKETLMEASDVLNLAVLDGVMPTFVHIRTMPETYSELLGQVSRDEYFAEDTTWANFCFAELNLQRGQKERAFEYWNNVLDLLEPRYDEESSYNLKLRLGLAYAGLGRKEEAVRMTREVLADFPLSWDALEGTLFLEMAALTFVRAGEYEAAIDQLDLLLSVPSVSSPALFRIDPVWDPLRNNPRFQKMMEGGR